MESKSGNSKKVIIGAVVLVAVVAILAIVYNLFREKPVEGTKAVTIEVTGKSGEVKSYEVKTDAEYLRQVMEEAEGLTFSGAERVWPDGGHGERRDGRLLGGQLILELLCERGILQLWY